MKKQNLFSLDIETDNLDDESKPYALEPWRVYSKQADISSVAISGQDGYFKQIHKRANNMDQLESIIRFLQGKYVVGHNAVFDIAFIIATLGDKGYELVRKINWLDTMLLGKWLHNSQKDKFMSLTLDNLVSIYIKDKRLTEAFSKMKQRAEVDTSYEYWLKRGAYDTKITRMLFLEMYKQMPKSMRLGYLEEQSNLHVVANGWLKGIDMNMDKIDKLENKIEEVQTSILREIDLPEGIITSPTKLRAYIEDELHLELPDKTPKGTGSTGKESLMKLHLNLAQNNDKRAIIISKILDFRNLATTNSKFVQGAIKARDYMGSNKMRAAPRIFGTYTGRFTYTNKIKKKWPIGIANHQLPRKGPIRSLLEPPEGYKIMELDAAGQEMRFMAHFSRDDHMVEAFNTGINLHSSMGASIGGLSYEEMVELYRDQDDDATNYRYAGKLLNLSCQYRISGRALAAKFFSTYGIVISPAEGARYESMYRQRYPGVPKYWNDAIQKATDNGYAESIGGRRFYITDWRRYRWNSESSAINFPIQGSGADHKNTAIKIVEQKFPDVIFVLDLHDGLWYYIPEDHYIEHALEIRDYLNNVNFSDIWNKERVVDFTFDVQVGDNFGNVKEL